LEQSVHIVGGGISGIIAALELEAAGYKPTIYEKQDHLGGRVRTDYIDGYPFDHGFQVLLTAYPEAQHYLDYDKLELQSFLSGSRVYYRGKTVRIGDPLSSATFWLDALDPTLSTFKDKVKTLQLSLKLKNKPLKTIFGEDETTALKYLQGLGFTDRVIERFFKPFFGGIFLETDLRTSSRLFEFLFKMFGNGNSVIPMGGMQKISDQLTSKLAQTTIRTGTAVEAVVPGSITLADGTSISSDHTIIATDLKQVNQAKDTVKWKRSINYYFEVDAPNYSDKIITLSANPNRLINNYYYPTNLIPHPEGKTILSTTVINDKGLSDAAIIEQIKAELKETGVKGELRLITSYDIPCSLPDVSNIHYELTPAQIKIDEGIYNCGDHTMMGSLNAAMYSGRYVAQHIINNYNI
jgi:protoporphyrinogen oxidase